MQVIGNLGKDCITNTVNGKTVMNFNIAHTEKFRDSSGQQKDKTTWVECAYWSDKTGVAPYLKKGTQVYAEGAPDVRHFTRNDGTAGASLTMRVFSVQLLGSGSRSEQPEPGPAYSDNAVTPAPAAGAPEAADDLPF